ncbi:MAG TPA: helix-hairpin-helix domain-containing protein [Silvibacterium sp.]|nr:helix-hairpin-helix domain-containing protein [Silvibacterium sp.]
MTVLCFTALASCVALFWLAGCTGPQSDQQIKQNAARTTEQVRAEAKQAAAEAKVAAANARREAKDIAAGVREGVHNNPSDADHSRSVDINSASQARLTTLPGISAARARRIINNRPYDAPRDLVRKGVLTQAEYDRISDDIVAGND